MWWIKTDITWSAIFGFPTMLIPNDSIERHKPKSLIFIIKFVHLPTTAHYPRRINIIYYDMVYFFNPGAGIFWYIRRYLLHFSNINIRGANKTGVFILSFCDFLNKYLRKLYTCPQCIIDRKNYIPIYRKSVPTRILLL